MILSDIYSHLKADAALRALLGAGETDARIYPNYAKTGAEAPFIVYRSLNPGGTREEVVSEETAAFEITAADYASLVAVSLRLRALLDMAQEGDIASASGRIFYGKLIGGADYADDLKRHVRGMTFIFRFRGGA